MAISAPVVNFLRGADVQASTLKVCAHNVSIDGVVGASQFGCTAGNGPGAGATRASLPASGAGHGGIGGTGGTGNTSIVGGPTYGSAMWPVSPGSGGGTSSSGLAIGGAGGGMVWVEADEIHIDGVRGRVITTEAVYDVGDFIAPS